MKYKGIHEESLKLKVAQEYFNEFDTTKIFGNIDFCVAIKHSKDKLFCSEVVTIFLQILHYEQVKGLKPHEVSPKDLARIFGLKG